MKRKKRMRAWIIFGIYLAATCALLLGCYSVQKPAVERQEFPFTITYSYQGKTETISDVYVAEYVRAPKYIGDAPVAWKGYVKDKDRLESDFYRIAEEDGKAFSINLNLEPGYIMGDPRYAGTVCQPTAVYHGFDGENEFVMTDPAELKQLGISVIGWEYPYPLENSFSFGGISMSSQATILTSAIAVAALLACMIVIKKRPRVKYGRLDKISAVFNFVVALVAFPFILITSALSEIVADASIRQQMLYLAPAVTVMFVAASVTLRRRGHRYVSFLIQFAGPAFFRLLLLFETI